MTYGFFFRWLPFFLIGEIRSYFYLKIALLYSNCRHFVKKPYFQNRIRQRLNYNTKFNILFEFFDSDDYRWHRPVYRRTTFFCCSWRMSHLFSHSIVFSWIKKLKCSRKCTQSFGKKINCITPIDFLKKIPENRLFFDRLGGYTPLSQIVEWVAIMILIGIM